MTLTLFKDLTAGYMSGKVLTKLESVSFLLTNHSPQQYAFLQTSPNSRNRTTFHATLARMIFVEDSSAKFVSFVKPLKDVLDGIANASGGGSSAVALRQNVPEDTVIGLFRDLHGIAQATLSRRAYMCASCLPLSLLHLLFVSVLDALQRTHRFYHFCSVAHVPQRIQSDSRKPQYPSFIAQCVRHKPCRTRVATRPSLMHLHAFHDPEMGSSMAQLHSSTTVAVCVIVQDAI